MTDVLDLADLSNLAGLPELSSPVLSLAALDGGLWVGGLGGVASLADDPKPPQGPLTSVAALCFTGPVLVAGGSQGIARRRVDQAGSKARSADPWERCAVRSGGAPVASMAAGPDGALLAATLGDGVLRSTDAGRTWETSNFGLDAAEVCSLAVAPGADHRRELLAGTTDGVFRSGNGGRAWRRCTDTQGIPIAGVAFCPDGSAYAAAEDGRVLCAARGEDAWCAVGTLLGIATALATMPDGTLLAGTADTGVWFSRDAGRSWRQACGFREARAVYCLLLHADRAYAGTERGLLASLDGAEWRSIPAPPTYDFSHSLVWRGRQLFIGQQSGLVQHGPDGTWERIGAPPLPLTCVAVTPDDTLLASGPSGLFRHEDRATGGAREGGGAAGWTCVLPGTEGMVGRMTFRDDGTGLAAPPGHGDSLLRTRDNGRTWERLSAPFGVLPPVTLQAFEKTVMVQTVDPRSDTLTVWGSRDDGTTWEQVWRGPNRGRPE